MAIAAAQTEPIHNRNSSKNTVELKVKSEPESFDNEDVIEIATIHPDHEASSSNAFNDWHSQQNFTKTPRSKYNKARVLEIVIALMHLSPSQHLEQILGTIDDSIIKETLKRMKDDVMYQIYTIMKNLKADICALLSQSQSICNQSLLAALSLITLMIYLLHFVLPIGADIYLNIANVPNNRNYQCSYLDLPENTPMNASAEPSFPIDIVILYAGDNDRSNNELKYTLRSIFVYMRWYNHIYIVAPHKSNKNNNISYPSFINESYSLLSDDITMISEDSLFSNASYAQNNHNSLSYEIVMHHISSLSEHFIYFNDDFLMGRMTPYTYFFNENGSAIRWNKGIIDAYMRDNDPIFVPTYSKWTNYTFSSYASRAYPLTMGQRARGYLEHHPRPLFKSYLFELEENYGEWFEFIASHKERYDSSLIRVQGINTDAVESESLHLHIIAHIINQQQPSFKSNTSLNVELIENDVIFSENVMIHYWAYSKHNLKPRLLRRITEELLCLKPVTFCINDNFDSNRKSKLYKEQSRIMQNFHQTYYGNVIPEWENGYAQNKPSHQHAINVAFKNHNFCAGRKSCHVF